MALRYGGVFEQDNIRYLLSSSTVANNFEGNYTAWEKKWCYAIPQNIDAYWYTDWVIDERNNLIYLDWKDGNGDNRWGIFNISDFSTVFLSNTGEDYLYEEPYCYGVQMKFGKADYDDGGLSHSIQSYFLLQRADYYTFEIWRNGTLLWARDIRDDFHTNNCWCDSAGLSLSGKYNLMMIVDYDPTPDIDYLVLYEGGTSV